MPLKVPNLDDRNYDDLLAEALARIPTHTPEWTNFNKSDPGVTLIEVFAFLTDNLLYRANQIPERNRKKFLSLLGVPLQPASPARGICTIANERGPQLVMTLNEDLEVRAGPVPFRTERGLDVLPIEVRPYYKKRLDNPDERLVLYYNSLYKSYTGHPPVAALSYYQTTQFSPRGTTGVDLGAEAIDQGSLWLALMVRSADAQTPDAAERAREAIAGKTLSLGLVPWITDTGRELYAGGAARPAGVSQIQFKLPNLPPGGMLPQSASARQAAYSTVLTAPVPTAPEVVEITMPGSPAALRLWQNLDPLESGVGDFPPSIDDEKDASRVITWLRLQPTNSSEMKLLWVGGNAVFVNQRARVQNELLPQGTGEPDQSVKLSRAPVIEGSLTLRVTPPVGAAQTWQAIDDLMSAGPEVPVPDPRLPAGTSVKNTQPVQVFQLDPEAGLVRFGDGAHGARPPLGATLRADYDYSAGLAGNVGAGSISTAPALPAGLKVTNPLPTWGGADAERVDTGEKQIPRFLQHRDRCVTTLDFETIARRTPGVAVGRVEVQPAWHPLLSPNEPGDAPGAVTLMLVPSFDPIHPDSPEPNQDFLDAVCSWIDPRRLVTTEVFLRGPVYQPIWISIGLELVAGVAEATVRTAVEAALRQFLSPLPDPAAATSDDAAALLQTPQYAAIQRGWPLRKPVVALELLAVANRVPGVRLVNQVLLALDPGAQAESVKLTPADSIRLVGLQLPRIAGLSVVTGDALPLDDLRGTPQAPTGPTRVPVPVIPETC